MSLTEVSVGSVVKRQYVSKMRIYVSLFTTLMATQLFAFIVSFAGISTTGTGSSTINFQEKTYSGVVIFAFTLIWAFSMGITLTTKGYRNDHYAFVTNRLTGHLSNLLVMLTASIMGGVTTTLSSDTFKLLIYFIYKNQRDVVGTGNSVHNLALGMLVGVLYLFLMATIAYFIGLLAVFSRLALIGLTAIVLAAQILESGKAPTPLAQFFQFYYHETSLLLFILKIIVSVACFFAVSVALTRQSEVRK